MVSYENKKGLQAEVEITDVAFGGRGLARLDGMAVFVDQAVPGDRVIIRIIRRKKNMPKPGWSSESNHLLSELTLHVNTAVFVGAASGNF